MKIMLYDGPLYVTVRDTRFNKGEPVEVVEEFGSELVEHHPGMFKIVGGEEEPVVEEVKTTKRFFGASTKTKEA